MRQIVEIEGKTIKSAITCLDAKGYDYFVIEFTDGSKYQLQEKGFAQFYAPNGLSFEEVYQNQID